METNTTARRPAALAPAQRRTGIMAAACVTAMMLAACQTDRAGGDPPDDQAMAGERADDPRGRFLANLAEHCGQAFPGRLALEPPGDGMLTGTEQLMVHFRDCGPDEVRIPFHVEIEGAGEADTRWDRSRTWFVIRHDDQLELRHDHRREDGSESTRTWYGGFSVGPGTTMRQDFESPERTAAAGVPVGWRIEIEPGVRYAYGTTYDGDYDWRVEFDLSRPLDGPPPLPWGHDREPSREPGPP